MNILQHTDEDINMLDCRISPYFTANTQILWPGRKVKAHGLDTWFTCTIEHAAGKYTATAFLVQGHEDRDTKLQDSFIRASQSRHAYQVMFLWGTSYIPNEGQGSGGWEHNCQGCRQ